MKYYVWETSKELRDEYAFYKTDDGRTVPNDVFRSDGRPVLWTPEFAENENGEVENSNLRLATVEEIAEGITVNELVGRNNEEECREKKIPESMS